MIEDIKSENLKEIKSNKINNMKGNMFLYWSAFVVGVVLTVFVYQAYTIFSLRTQIANDHATLTQVVDFLNQNIQQAQQKTGQSGTQVQAPASTSTKK